MLSLIKKKFTLCWRWFYRMQIPLIIGYHKFMQDLSTFHVWGTICMNQSLNVTKNLKKGTILKKSDLICKRPAHGICASFFEQLIGKKINTDIQEDTAIQTKMII